MKTRGKYNTCYSFTEKHVCNARNHGEIKNVLNSKTATSNKPKVWVVVKVWGILVKDIFVDYLLLILRRSV